MKQTFIILLSLLLFPLLVQAQEETETSNSENEYLKPDYGMFTIEYNMGLGDNPISLENVRARYFIDYNLALRAGLVLDYRNESPDENTDINSTRAGIKAGLEFHLDGTKRLSPYFGFEGRFISQGYNEKFTNPGTGATSELRGGLSSGEVAFTEYGGSLLAGADFYVAKNLYLGLELGLDIIGQSDSDVEQDASGTVTKLSDGGSRFRIGFNALNFFRIGYAF